MLLAFMMSRGLKKLEGEKAAIGMQANGTASLVVDDPLQIGERFFENNVRFTKTELQEVVYSPALGPADVDRPFQRGLGNQLLEHAVRQL